MPSRKALVEFLGILLCNRRAYSVMPITAGTRVTPYCEVLSILPVSLDQE